MMEDWLWELLKGLGRLFLNPVLYWFIICVLLASRQRISKERRLFGTKIFDIFSESKRTASVSLIAGIILSLLSIGLGIVFDFYVLLLIAAVTIALSLFLRFSLLSAAYTLGFSYLIILAIQYVYGPETNIDILEELQHIDAASFTIIIGFFLIVEAFLLLRIDQRETFPEVVKGNRGKWIGQHRLKKAVIIPFFALLPSGFIEPFAPWWPIFTIEGDSYGLVLIPFLIGFEHVAKGFSPVVTAKKLGNAVLILSLIVIGFAISSYYYAFMSLVAVVVAIVGREWISYRHRLQDQQKSAYFSPSSTGMLVLGVIPGTPADGLGLLAGERIEKVNGKVVTNVQEFYEALHTSSASCRLDVRDDRGEIRFVQRAMYQGEHHELGIVFGK
ncbi:PDZ domain-containing protein [Radiobacillus kanasensis]|uniref:PDZ domain-containing protein n=1 Tax=Radiobacillus kanasensis TaxID=2844358 RepID=UPI001E525560|nr:PDZ domain-containing protein [Radiobacillus kanasensis]UFT98524.1 PDZ domain-containing protein [Radiobacillus kanasensis]